MDSRHNAGTNAGNEAAVPVVRHGTHHQSVGWRTSRRAPETGQAARSNACGSSGDVSRNGRAGVDDDGRA